MPPSSPDAPPGDRPPPSVIVALAILALLAVLLLLSAALTWFGREAVVESFLAAQPTASRNDVERNVVVGVVLSLVIGLLAVAAGAGLLLRRAWARWAGVAVGVLLGGVSLFFAAQSGGVTAYLLLQFVLSVATVSTLLARPSAEWVSARSRT